MSKNRIYRVLKRSFKEKCYDYYFCIDNSIGVVVLKI